MSVGAEKYINKLLAAPTHIQPETIWRDMSTRSKYVEVITLAYYQEYIIVLYRKKPFTKDNYPYPLAMNVDDFLNYYERCPPDTVLSLICK